MTARRVAAALNVDPDHRFEQYMHGDQLALLTVAAYDLAPLLFIVDEDDTQRVLDTMWAIGNRSWHDTRGNRWPADVRSLSVGDVLIVYPPGYPLARGAVETYAVGPVGFDPIPAPPPGVWVPLEGTDATSRSPRPRAAPLGLPRAGLAAHRTGLAVRRGERSVAELAEAAYEAVRALNHATFPAQCEITSHEDLYRVVGSLAAMLHITPQALRQAAAWATRAHRDGRLAVDATSPTDPAETVAAIEAVLAQAAAFTTRAGQHTDAAHEAAAHLTAEPDQPGM